jgi:hypothetical protein
VPVNEFAYHSVFTSHSPSSPHAFLDLWWLGVTGGFEFASWPRQRLRIRPKLVSPLWKHALNRAGTHGEISLTCVPAYTGQTRSTD